jgi:hypothetical protein
VQCSKCKTEMRESKVQVPDERALLITMVERTQHTCLNSKCEAFNHPIIARPLPSPRFPRGKEFLSNFEQWRLDQLRKVAMAPGFEETSLKVVDAIGTYLMAGFWTLAEIGQEAPSQAVKVRAAEVQRGIQEKSGGQLVTFGPGDVIVNDRKTHQMVLHKKKSEWTKEDENRYPTSSYFLQWGEEFTLEWLVERLKGDDLQAELLRLFRDYPRMPVRHQFHDGALSGSRGLMDTAEGIAMRLGKGEEEVHRELDKLEKLGVFYRTERGEYFATSLFDILGKPKPKPPELPQVTPEMQQKIVAACLRILREVAISSEYEDTALAVVQALETIQGAAPALFEIELSARSPAVRTHAHNALTRMRP